MKRTLLLSCVVFGVAGLSRPVSAGMDMPSFVQTTPYAVLVKAESHADAEDFVNNLADQGIGFLGDTSISKDKQKSEFQKLLRSNFDMNTIARFTLGRHWKTATDEQRKEYMNLFNDMIIEVYSSRFSEYRGQTLDVVGSRDEGKNDVLVNSIIKQDSGPDVRVDWRVRKKDGRYKVIDVLVEGVSMALTQRSDFSSVIQRGGGDVEVLLAHLRKQ